MVLFITLASLRLDGKEAGPVGPIIPVPAVRISADVPIVKIGEYKLREGRFAPAVVSSGNYIYIIGGVGRGGGTLKSVERFDIRTGATEHFCDLQTPRFSHQAALIGDRIFVIGGNIEPVSANTLSTEELAGDARSRSKLLDEVTSEGFPFSEVVDTVEVIDLQTRSVSQGPRMPAPRAAFASVTKDTNIIVLGGKTVKGFGRGYSNRTAVLDTKTLRWNSGVPIPFVGETAAVRLDANHFLIGGGYDGKRVFSDVFAFREETGDWVQLPALCMGRSATTAVLAGKYVLFFGDYSKPEEILAYDMITKKSETFLLGYTESRHAAAIAVGDHIYVIGGKKEKTSEPYALVQEFVLRGKR